MSQAKRPSTTRMGLVDRRRARFWIAVSKDLCRRGTYLHPFSEREFVYKVTYKILEDVTNWTEWTRPRISSEPVENRSCSTILIPHLQPYEGLVAGGGSWLDFDPFRLDYSGTRMPNRRLPNDVGPYAFGFAQYTPARPWAPCTWTTKALGDSMTNTPVRDAPYAQRMRLTHRRHLRWACTARESYLPNWLIDITNNPVWSYRVLGRHRVLTPWGSLYADLDGQAEFVFEPDSCGYLDADGSWRATSGVTLVHPSTTDLIPRSVSHEMTWSLRAATGDAALPLRPWGVL